MGAMKQYLIDKTRELADMVGIPEADFYSGNPHLSNLARAYAQYHLEIESKQANFKEEMKRVITTRLDEVVSLLQEMTDTCPGENFGACPTCPWSFICAKAPQYK